jgi:hypothetical protein
MAQFCLKNVFYSLTKKNASPIPVTIKHNRKWIGNKKGKNGLVGKKWERMDPDPHKTSQYTASKAMVYDHFATIQETLNYHDSYQSILHSPTVC